MNGVALKRKGDEPGNVAFAPADAVRPVPEVLPVAKCRFSVLIDRDVEADAILFR
jgi:hypothetical protein